MLPKMRVSVSNKCQMSCIYCKGEKGLMENFGPQREIISTYGLIEIIRIGIESSLKDVHFTGGEPFLRPDFFGLVRSIVELGAKVEINTNGLLLTEEKAKLLKEAGCSLLKISLDTIGEEKFASFTGINALKRVIDGIRAVNSIIPVRINCVVTRSNIDDIIPLIDLMNDIGIPRIHFLDLTYYPFVSGKQFWEKEFVDLTKEVKPLIEAKTNNKFGEVPIFGCNFSALASKSKGTVVVLKEANCSMRSPLHCSCCQSYCHEGMFTLRLSAGGYLNICPETNGLGIDAIAALKKGRLAEEYKRFSRIFDSTEQVKNSFPIFLERNKLKTKEGDKIENMLS